MTNLSKQKARMARWSFSKHQWLALVAGISLLIWGISGLSHIWMVLYGPQQAVFMPPVQSLNLADTRPIAEILSVAGIDKAIAIRTVPGPTGTLYQITSNEINERRYFDPSSGIELIGQDARQAEFLARHYLKENRSISSITLQNQFDSDYPWVNRLLPVWAVRFEGDDGLVAYVHTETSSLASVNNNFKNTQQRIFSWLHNWDWIPAGFDWLRVAIVTFLVGSLTVMSITGIMMLISIRRSKSLPGAKGWHRISGYILALPLLMFSASGIYHLFQFAIDPPTSQLRMAQPLNLTKGRFPIERDWMKITQGQNIRGLSLVEGPDGQPLYRLELGLGQTAMGGEHDHHDHAAIPPSNPVEIRKARFDGLQPSKPPVYVDASTGEVLPLADRDLAVHVAKRFIGTDKTVKDVSLVTHFSADYDFRNKRLPVWKIDFAEPIKASLFIDTVTGALVDRVADWQKPERWVFSLVHKWNFLFPLGKLTLNMVVGGAVVALIGLMGLIGLWLDLKRRTVPSVTRLKRNKDIKV